MASVFCSKASQWTTFAVKESLKGDGYDTFHVLNCTVLYCGNGCIICFPLRCGALRLSHTIDQARQFFGWRIELQGSAASSYVPYFR